VAAGAAATTGWRPPERLNASTSAEVRRSLPAYAATSSRRTPSSRASRRTDGAAATGPRGRAGRGASRSGAGASGSAAGVASFFGSGAGSAGFFASAGASAALAPPPSTLRTGCPILTSSPTSTRTFSTVPATVDGSSNCALSVSRLSTA
jgi:hypothetical protein